jgi:hypothetical protein
MSLKESLSRFIAPSYGKTTRTSATYQTIAAHCTRHISQLVEEYHAVENDQQLLRELRIDLDYYLRRYHEYCIKQRDGMLAHYHEIGSEDDCDFEHLIPITRIRDLLLFRVITVEQALNAPTVRLSRSKHKMLKSAGWDDKTPDMWLPFRRYSNVFAAQFQTHDGTAIDAETWTLERHYEYFQHLVL